MNWFWQTYTLVEKTFWNSLSRKLCSFFFISLFQLGFVALLWFYFGEVHRVLEAAQLKPDILQSLETTMNRALQGGCQVPIGAYALVEGEEVWLRGLVGSPDGSRVIRDEIRGPLADGEALGHTLAQRLLADGADVILAEVYRA